MNLISRFGVFVSLGGCKEALLTLFIKLSTWAIFDETLVLRVSSYRRNSPGLLTHC